MPRTIAIGSLLLALALAMGPSALAEGEEDGAREGEAVPLPALLERVRDATDLPLTWVPRERGIVDAHVRDDLVLEGPPEVVLQRLRTLLLPHEVLVLELGDGPDRRLLVTSARAMNAVLRMPPTHVVVSQANVDALARQDGVFVSTLIPLPASVEPMQLASYVMRLVTGGNVGHVVALRDPPALLVADFAPVVAEIWRLVQAIGPAGAERAVKAIRLEHAAAVEVAAILTRQLTDPVAGPPQARGPEPAGGRLRIQGDPRTNQVLVTGPAVRVREAAEAVALLDVPAPAAPQPAEVHIQVVRLEHADARQLASTLQVLVNTAFAGVPTSGPRPTVVAEPSTNSLVLQASGDFAQLLLRTISELDVPADAGR